MWYFAWTLGTGLTAVWAILNGLWFELKNYNQQHMKKDESEEKAVK